MSEDDTKEERPSKRKRRNRKGPPPEAASPPPVAPEPAPEPAPVRASTPDAFVVVKGAHYVLRGMPVFIAEGTRVTARSHDLDALLEQGVELEAEG